MDMPRPSPTARRPLLGLHILLVEDSRVAGAAIRAMCLRSGARLRRAATLADAARHLTGWAPQAAIVDMGLPDGSGAALIRCLCRARPRPGAVLGLSGDPAAEDEAMEAGADRFLSKPLHSLGAFQEALLGPLPAELRPPPGPRALAGAFEAPADPDALRDDLEHAAELLRRSPADDGGEVPLAYLGRFLAGVAASAGDEELSRAALRFGRPNGAPSPEEADRLAILLRARLGQGPPRAA